jgi:hypothetical protein
MIASLLLLAGLWASTDAAAAGEQNTVPSVRTSDDPRPRDGNIAIRQELDAARQAGTVEAYDLFIARHPRHDLTEIARRERAELVARNRR